MYTKAFIDKVKEEEKAYEDTAKDVPQRAIDFKTDSDIPVKMLYTPLDLKEDQFDKISFPGSPPYTRGIYPTMYRGRLWTTRLFSGFGTPEDTNARWKILYKAGERGFSAALDSLTIFGFDPDDPIARSEVGKTGVPLYCTDSMFALTDGLPIDTLSVALVCEPISSAPVCAMYFNMAQAKGYDLKKVIGTSQNDILTFTIGVTPIKSVSPPDLLRLACDLIEWCVPQKHVPKWHPINFTGYNYREGGVTAIQELGFVFGSAMDHIDNLIQRGWEIDQFINRMAFHLAAHKDFFEEIAKFRAARRIWYKLITEKYKCKDPRSAQFKFHVQTAGSSLTSQNPQLNIARTAIQGLEAVLGGCQSLHTNAYDEGICIPSEEAAILAIRTQQVIEDETRVTHTVDPMAGSYYVESLTDEIEERVWKYLDKIADQGGIVKSLENGWIYREMQEAFYRRRKNSESGEEVMIGVNKYPEPADTNCDIFRPNPLAAEIECERIRKLKKERDNASLETILSQLRKTCEKKQNVMPLVMAATKAGATVAEIVNVYREIWGVWEAPVII